MKQFFFYGLLFVIPFLVIGWLLWALGRGLAAMYEDWKLDRDVSKLRADSETRREQQRLENEQRLATGCEHDFDGHILGLPSGVCSKCGIQKVKPAGPCDHVWRLGTGSIPDVCCEKCGATYRVSGGRGSFG